MCGMNGVSIFQVFHLKKTEQTLNQFSSSFHLNDRNVSGHLILVTSDLENVGQCKNLSKFSSLVAFLLDLSAAFNTVDHSICSIVCHLGLVFLALHLTGLNHVYHLAYFSPNASGLFIFIIFTKPLPLCILNPTSYNFCFQQRHHPSSSYRR